ncbi:NB4M subunit of mitochondrial NADH:ubiquinone oxidoreductase (complex I), putative [Geotrichum candidum]|uniref:NB4M subunit of mitochondrial NADH:ubiquinone oxidoreductase (Complex I), putative n=1 Tax=Geotrichum candidum TaxID=1173061 RepID=A0A0J9XFB5_GEOCN|nr:NB4M subunit of mitochondrial NADH:ubiquinone oxidoreductase (complex I), putative [Geotrichum candidum]
MTTTATAFAQTTRISKNALDMKKRVLSLYRSFIRNAPHFAETYDLSYPTSLVRSKLRQEFERNRFVSDLPTINILHAKGQMEFQETVNFWKQGPHILKYFAEEERVKAKTTPNTFVDKFLQGSL